MWGNLMPEAQLVFGKKARERALKAKLKELEVLEEEYNKANDEMVAISSLLEGVDTLKIPLVVDSMSRMLGLRQKIDNLEHKLELLELGDAENLDKLLKQIISSIGVASIEQDNLQKKVGGIEAEQKALKIKKSGLSDKKDETQETISRCSDIIEDIAQIWAEFNIDDHLNYADQEARSLNKTITLNEKSEVDKYKNSEEQNLYNVILEHNQNCNKQDAIIYIGRESGEYNQKLFKVVCETQVDIQRVRSRLKNNVYYKHQKELEKIRHTFDDTFITSFCHSIYTALNNGKQQINQLNNELQNHSFGADQEKFRFDAQWITEFKEYNQFFKDVASNLQLGEASVLFGKDSFLSEGSQKVRDKIKEMLLDNDGLKAQQGLKRISDYRNYRRYEIYKEVEGKDPIPLSQYGTGSGGQLETPAYIIRSASITSAFRFSETGSHLKMVLVDEAFSFMDEERSREIIDYLTHSLGLQLTFIMPSNKCGPFMNVVNNHYNFVKSDSSSKRGELNTQVMVDFKILKKEKVIALWKKQEKITYQQGEISFMKEVLGSN